MTRRTLSLHYSPCPNDTFIFAGIALGKISLPGIRFDIHLQDIEELNHTAVKAEADVIKLSYHAFLSAVDDYVILDAGSALGEGVGPLLVAKAPFPLEDLRKKTIAIPGEHTTANLLLKLTFGKHLYTTPVLFSDIEDAVLSDSFDAGLIIHENRFTYADRGLFRLADLGELWEKESGLPVPLGGIAARRGLGKDLLKSLDKAILESIDWAVENPEEAMPYIREHAQAMDREVMENHIGLYVTDYTRSLGPRGREAIRKMFEMATKKGLIPSGRKQPFI